MATAHRTTVTPPLGVATRPPRVSSFVARLRRRWPYVLAATLASVLTALAVGLAHDDRHRADAVVVVNVGLLSRVSGLVDLAPPSGDTGASSGAALPGDLGDELVDRLVAAEVAWIESDRVRDTAAARLGTDTMPDVTGIAGDGGSITVRVEAADATTATLAVNAIADAYTALRDQDVQRIFTEAVTDLQQLIADLDTRIDAADDPTARSAIEDERAAVVELLAGIRGTAAVAPPVASVSEQADHADRLPGADLLTLVLVALAAGLALGVLCALVIDLLDDRLTTPGDLLSAGFGGRAIAVVPLDPTLGRIRHLRRAGDPSATAHRVLRNQLLAAGLERPVVQLVPVHSGAGSTTTAAHLAVVLAEQLPHVAVVDLDLRRPALHAVFGVAGSLGVTDVLAGDELDVAALPVGDSLDVLAAGAVPPDPSVFLSTALLGGLVARLRERYDAVVIDTPAVTDAGDALLVAPLVDLTVVVVTAGRTRTRELRALVERFEHHGVHVDAIVLNQARRPRRRAGTADPADSVLAAAAPITTRSA